MKTHFENTENHAKPAQTIKNINTTKNEPKGPRKAVAKTWLKRFQKTIILGFAATVLYRDLIECLNFKLVLGSRAPAGAILYPKKDARTQPKKHFFSFSESRIRCVKFGAPPGFSFLCSLFAFLHLLASRISTPFVVPFVPEAVQRCKYQGSHNGKMRNAGCMLGT